MCGLSGDGAPGLTAPDGGNQELGMRKGNKRKGNAHSKGEGGILVIKKIMKRDSKKGICWSGVFLRKRKEQ